MAHDDLMKALLPLLALAALSACSAGDNDPGPGGVTAGEAHALDDAAAMLEERRMPEAALTPQPEASSASQPATTPAAPSPD